MISTLTRGSSLERNSYSGFVINVLAALLRRRRRCRPSSANPQTV